jgi:hypothetical protein
MVAFGEGGITTYRSQIFGITQQEGINMKQILSDLVKDHLIPHIARKNTSTEMYDALGALYQSVNVFRKMFLKNMITSTCMCKIIQWKAIS